MIIKRTFIASLLLIGVILVFRENKSELKLLRGLTTQEDVDLLLDEASRPIMHTFFSPIWPNRVVKDPMLDEWRDQWAEAGFSTKVLTLADARKHPYFEEMRTGVEKAFPTDIYNQLCFYRYLAMAAAGGGWMSDYDTFPTNFPLREGKDLPNGGNFTSYQAHVPSLIAASPEEWERVGKLLVDAIPRIENDVKSDMYALLQLREEANHDIVFLAPSWNVKMWFNYEKPHEVNCRDMGIGRAIHFSHSAMSHAYHAEPRLLPLEDATWPMKSHERANAARNFMEEWRKQCGGSNIESTSSSTSVAV